MNKALRFLVAILVIALCCIGIITVSRGLGWPTPSWAFAVAAAISVALVFALYPAREWRKGA